MSLRLSMSKSARQSRGGVVGGRRREAAGDRGSEAIIRLKFTAVDCSFFLIRASSNCTGGPTHNEVRPKWEDHGRAIDIGLKAHSFLGRRQGEVECSAKDDWVQLAKIGTDGGVKDLRLHQKSGRIRPVQGGNANVAASLNKSTRVNSCE